jgi:hypothetical protein
MGKKHVVQQGECLASIAARYGLGSWKVLLDDPDNAPLKQQKRDPFALLPGDEVMVRDPKPKAVSLPSSASHRVTISVQKTMLNLRLELEDGKPIAGKAYVLTVGAERFEGKTTGDGRVELQLPASVSHGTLAVLMKGDPEGERHVWSVRLGHLNPADVVSGVKQRLNNLGFFAGPPNEEADETLAVAVRGFQAFMGLEVTGDVDDATRAKLVDAHGKI